MDQHIYLIESNSDDLYILSISELLREDNYKANIISAYLFIIILYL